MLEFVIIGAQKSGSTALMRDLASHPGVYLPAGETRYFRDPWFQFQDQSHLEAEVAAAPLGVRRGIKCPDYLAAEHCAERIRETLGQIPLIAVLREPVERAVSAYFWGMQWGWIPLVPPEVGLLRVLDGSMRVDHPRVDEVLEYGLYGKHLQRFSSLFGRDRLLVLSDEELREDRDGTLRAVFKHIGVSDEVPVSTSDRTVNAGVYSMHRLRFLKLRHNLILREFAGYHGRYLQPPEGLLARALDQSIAGVDRLVLEKLLPNDRPFLPAHVTEALADYYREDLQLLAEITGRDVSKWQQRHKSIA